MHLPSGDPSADDYVVELDGAMHPLPTPEHGVARLSLTRTTGQDPHLPGRTGR